MEQPRTTITFGLNLPNGIAGAIFLQDKCPSCHWANSIKTAHGRKQANSTPQRNKL